MNRDDLARLESELHDQEAALAARESLSVQNPATALAAAVKDLARQEHAVLPGGLVLAQARATQQAIADLTVIGLTQLAEIDDRRLHALEDAPSTSVWAQRLALDVPRGQVALARRLARYGQVHAQLRAGRITLSSAQAVGQVLTRLERFLDAPDGLLDGQPQQLVLHSVLTSGVRPLICRSRGGSIEDAGLQALIAELHDVAESGGPAVAQLEGGLLVLAREVAPEQLRSCLGVLLAALLPRQLEKAALAGRDARTLQLSRLEDGSGWVLRGHLDVITGELLFTVLQAQLATDPLNPQDTAAGRDLRSEGHDPRDADLREDVSSAYTPGSAAGRLTTAPRSRAERVHDALRGALAHYLDSALAGTRGKARPHLSVTVPAEALQAQPGAMPAESASGACLATSVLVHLWPDSSVTRFVLGLKGSVIGASHTSRTATRLERLAKHLHTGGWCETAGCRRRTGQLGSTFHQHHLDPWSLSGTTQLGTSALLCSADHRALHEGATLILRDGRQAGPRGWSPPPGGRSDEPPF